MYTALGVHAAAGAATTECAHSASSSVTYDSSDRNSPTRRSHDDDDGPTKEHRRVSDFRCEVRGQIENDSQTSSEEAASDVSYFRCMRRRSREVCLVSITACRWRYSISL